MSEPQPFTLTSFREEARRLLESAREEADRIRDLARAEAAGIRETAKAEGVSLGRIEGLQVVAADAVAASRRAVAQVEAARAELEREAERDLVRLAVAMAGRMVRAEVTLGRPVAAAALAEAVRRAARRRVLEIRLHPDDLAAIRGAAELPPGAKVVADPAVGRGGCVALVAEGAIDLSIDAQLDEIERGLLEG